MNSSTTALLPSAAGSTTPALPDAARASAAIPATAPAQIGRKRLMAPTMPDARPKFPEKLAQSGSQLGDCGAGVSLEICRERRQMRVVNLAPFSNREYA